MLREAMASCDRILAAARDAGRRICYAENWVYAPAVQKEREILVKSGGQILWVIGDESHSGSHSPYYGIWKLSGGGALVGKGCHPLTAVLYLKRAEGEARDHKPIRPATVSARTHEITRLKTFRDAGFLRTNYEDIEDYGYKLRPKPDPATRAWTRIECSHDRLAELISCSLFSRPH